MALIIGAQPAPPTWAAGLPLLVAGEFLRTWAAGHIGDHSRGRSLRAPRLVTTGPYALMRHPLYVGNGLACAGLLLIARAFWPWLPIGFGILFAIQYALFIRREERFLRREWGSAWEDWVAGRPPRSGVPEALTGEAADHRIVITESGTSRTPGDVAERPRPASGAALRPFVTRAGLRLEWPTLRTILALLLLLIGMGLLRRP